MSPLLPKALTIAGLIFDIVGVCLLAYDALYGAGRHWWLGLLDKYLKQAERDRDASLATWERMAERGSSEPYIAQLTSETLGKYEERRRRIEDKIRDWKDNYPRKVSNLAYRGLLLVILGFILQIIGTALS
jgi:uncharacterized membrane protein